MRHRVFIIICLVCLLFSGCGITKLPVDSESTTDVPINSESTPDTQVDGEPAIDVVVAGESGVIATSGSAADIQAAADAVYAAGGGTVYIPEGTFSLGGSATIRGNVKLIGAGIRRTILRTQGESMRINAQGDNIRVSGFSLISTNYDGDDGIFIDNCVDFRVDHCYIEGYDYCGVCVRGIDIRGVVDHCEIKMKVATLGYGVMVYRDDFWEEDMHLGTEQATFIEDCVFVNARHAVASNAGAHYVFRHNLVKQGVISHQIDAHGPAFGSEEGTRCVEVYENVIEPPASVDEKAIGIRGGGGVIFNNTISGYDYAVMLLIEDEQDLSSYPVYHQVHDLWIWNNSHDGLAEVYIPSVRMSNEYIQEGRDYFRYAKPGYTPYTYPHPLVRSSS